MSAAVGLGALLGLGWAGLQVEPIPFRPYPHRAVPQETGALPNNLPAPVARYFAEVVGDPAPTITSAVLTGRGRLHLFGVTFPTRFRFTHLAGQGYRHYIECTWFGIPVLKVNESYLDGHARLELPVGIVANEPKVDLAANLALWGEAIWFPSLLATDPRVHWEAIDATSARLVVPFGESEDRFIVVFDEATGLIQWIEALRYRAASDEAKTPWRIEPRGWQTFAGLRIPSPGAVTWMDEGTPWLILTLEDVVFNADVTHYLHASGL
jgi:hypothetical protein